MDPQVDTHSETPLFTEALIHRFHTHRQRTQALIAPLPVEDMLVQTMDDVSPTRWHIAHTTWFFETFLLLPHLSDYTPFRDGFEYLFNSYYEGAGPQFPRHRRGTLGRPRISEILDYRQTVDAAMTHLLESQGTHIDPDLAFRVELGLQHEMQHQELLLTDIKHVLANNPLRPTYLPAQPRPERTATPLSFLSFDPGVREIGFSGSVFSFDNEQPRHRVFLESFQLANRPVTCGEYLEFILDGGYQESRLWLSEGWTTRQNQGWEAPMYWFRHDDHFEVMTLRGWRPLDPHEPVTHLSYFEADAYARWAQKRLPTEAEWEIAAANSSIDGNLLEAEHFHPQIAPTPTTSSFSQLFGDIWEWTSSAYSPYPGFQSFPGTLGEYNGKFMCNQFVLRGGSCVTPKDQLRPTYRNFFSPSARWQFSGFRLAQSL